MRLAKLTDSAPTSAFRSSLELTHCVPKALWLCTTTRITLRPTVVIRFYVSWRAERTASTVSPTHEGPTPGCRPGPGLMQLPSPVEHPATGLAACERRPIPTAIRGERSSFRRANYLTRATIATNRLAAARMTCHLSGTGHFSPSCLSDGASITTTSLSPSRPGTRCAGPERSANWLAPPLSSRGFARQDHSTLPYALVSKDVLWPRPRCSGSLISLNRISKVRVRLGSGIHRQWSVSA